MAAEIGRAVYVVHRLDRGTSGVMVFALTTRHQIDKRYWGLCRGTLLGGGTVDVALVPIRGGKVRVAQRGEAGGKPSETAWRALERFGGPGDASRGFTAVEARPRSGRRHQVRAHLGPIGQPLDDRQK